MAVMDFDATLTEWRQEFKFKGCEYLLVEASGGSVCDYKDSIMSAMTLNDASKPVKIGGFQRPELELLATCIRVKDGFREIGIELVEKWPNKITDQLIDLVKEKSNVTVGSEDSLETLEKKRDLLDKQIEEKQADTVGNVPSSTTTGS